MAVVFLITGAPALGKTTLALRSRFSRRAAAGGRHPSHHDMPDSAAAVTYAPRLANSEMLTVPIDDFRAQQYRAAVALAIERAQALLRRSRR